MVKRKTKTKKKSLTDEEIEEMFGERTIDDLFEDEVRKIFDEMQYGPHCDDPTYKTQTESLKSLIDAYNSYKKATTEQEKVEAKKQCEKVASGLDPNVIVPVLIKAGLSLVVILFWISIEQGRPTPNKLVNWTSNLLIPR